MDRDGLPGDVSGSGDRRQQAVRRTRVDRYDRWCGVDGQDLRERAGVTAAIGDVANNGVVAVAQRTIKGQRPCATLTGSRLVGLGDTVNDDSDRARSDDTRDTRDCRVGNGGVDRWATVDRHGWCAREQVVVGHGDRTRFGQQATVDNAAVARADCAVGHQGADERVEGTEAAGPVDLPEHVLGLRSINQIHGGTGTERERCIDLEDEHSIGMALTINGEAQSSSRRDGYGAGVHTGSKGLAADVALHRSASRTAFGVRVSSLKVGVCVCESRCNERCSKMAVANKRVGRRTGVTTERCRAGAGERRVRSQRTERLGQTEWDLGDLDECGGVDREGLSEGSRVACRVGDGCDDRAGPGCEVDRRRDLPCLVGLDHCRERRRPVNTDADISASRSGGCSNDCRGGVARRFGCAAVDRDGRADQIDSQGLGKNPVAIAVGGGNGHGVWAVR